MLDNGLLKYYPQYFDEFGRLELDKIKKKKEELLGDNHRVVKFQHKRSLFSKDKSPTIYYEKSLGRNLGQNRGVQVDIADTEVLLSQIYAKAGLKTAIYLPTINKDNVLGVISNEIKSSDSKSKLFFAELAENAYESYKEPYDVGCKYTEKELALQSYFKEKALKDYVTMHILDVACGNTDRHDLNFFVDVVKDDNNLPIIQDIRLFDYGHGGMAYSNLFVNGLGNGRLKNKAEMIEEFKTNEYVNMFYTPTEMSEMLGNIDVVETARDVKETINYEIDDGLVTKFARLIDDTAESLIK